MAAEEGAETDTEASKPEAKAAPFVGPGMMAQKGVAVPGTALLAGRPLVSPFAANSDVEIRPSTPGQALEAQGRTLAAPRLDQPDQAAAPRTPDPAARLSASALTQALNSLGRTSTATQPGPSGEAVAKGCLSGPVQDKMQSSHTCTASGVSQPERAGETCCQNEATSPQISFAAPGAAQQTGGPAVAPASIKAEGSSAVGTEKPEKKAGGFNKDAKKYRGVRQRPWGKWAAGVLLPWFCSHAAGVTPVPHVGDCFCSFLYGQHRCLL